MSKIKSKSRKEEGRKTLNAQRSTSNVEQPEMPPGTAATTAIGRAEEMFHRNQPGEHFILRLGLYLRHACVIVTPTLFAMLRPVKLDGDEPTMVRLVDPRVQWDAPNAWYVDLAVGPLHQLIGTMPYRLPWICFCRKGGDALKIYETTEFVARCRAGHLTEGSGASAFARGYGGQAS